MKLVLLGLDSCQRSVLWSRTEFPELLTTLIEETTAVVIDQIQLRISSSRDFEAFIYTEVLAESGAKKSTVLNLS